MRRIGTVLGIGLIAAFLGRSATLSSLPVVHEATPVNSKLDAMIDEVQLDPMRLDDAIEILRAKTGANIVVHWEVLSGSGIEPSRVVSLELKSVPLKTALCHLLESISTEVTFTAGDDGVIVVSSRVEIEQRYVMRFYDLSEIVSLEIQCQAKWELDRASLIRQIDPLRVVIPNISPYEPSHDECVDRIIELIASTANPLSWMQNGGVGGIRADGDLLVVCNNAEVQEQVEVILDHLRETLKKHADGLPLPAKIKSSTMPSVP